ncbi:MAG: CapA family protein [Candidatus Paceibacterota bacterium]
MDEQEEKSLGFKEIISALAVLVFIWGALWTGSRGLNLAIHSDLNGRGLTSAASDSNGRGNNVVSVSSAVGHKAPNIASGRGLTSAPTPPPAGEPAQKQTLTIIVGGDIMLDRAIRKLGDSIGYENLFKDITPLLKSVDLAVANLEGPITTYPSKTLLANGKTSKELTFTFAPETVPALAEAGFTTFSLANNHTANFGQEGLNQTRKFLKKENLGYFGSPANASSSALVIEKNGISIALVGYHAFGGGFEDILASIKRLNDAGNFVIVMPHWGTEYAASASAKLKSQAQAFVQAGAKAIIGAHPHVILEHEKIEGVPVFYSVGNLIIDQYFSPEVMKGNLVQMTLKKDSQGTSIDSIKIYQTSIASKQGVALVGEPVDF